MSLSFPSFAGACREHAPHLALVLGSGMGEVVDRWGRRAVLPFGEVPGLTGASVPGHRGQFSLVEIGGRPALVQEGRLHFYEGHPWERVVQPARILAELGARTVLHTNAAGGIHDALGPGSLMAIRDHLEWTRPFWWRTPGPSGTGGARQSPYSARLLDVLTDAACQCGIELQRGVYASLTGPSYETAAEIRALRTWDADAVGMSTAREVQMGVECGMECAAVSCITNRAAGLSASPLSHEDVLKTAALQNERVASLIEAFAAAIPR